MSTKTKIENAALEIQADAHKASPEHLLAEINSLRDAVEALKGAKSKAGKPAAK